MQTRDETAAYLAELERSDGTCISGVLIVAGLVVLALLRCSPTLGALALVVGAAVGWRWPNTLVLENLERKGAFLLRELPYFFVCSCCSGRYHDLPLKQRRYDDRVSDFVNFTMQTHPGLGKRGLRLAFLRHLLDEGLVQLDDLHPQLVQTPDEWNFFVDIGVPMHQPRLRRDEWEEVDGIFSSRGEMRIQEGKESTRLLPWQEADIPDVYEGVRGAILHVWPGAQLAPA